MKDMLITVYGGGDEAVDAAEKLAGLNRWIPVDEKPPEIGRRVLGLWMSHKGAVQSVRGAIGGWIDDDGNVTAAPTHWMPLPEPPNCTTQPR